MTYKKLRTAKLFESNNKIVADYGGQIIDDCTDFEWDTKDEDWRTVAHYYFTQILKADLRLEEAETKLAAIEKILTEKIDS